MRKVAWILLLLFAFTIPWEISLNLGEPLGNAARIAGILVLLAAVPAIFETGRIRPPGVFNWITLALFLWFCLTCFWSIDSMESLAKLRAYFQEFMIVWLLWEFADTPEDLRNLLRATVAGSWLLALLTLAALRSPEAMAAGQIRFAAYGQDPNDVARFLDLGFPLAALLAHCERRRWLRAVAIGFLPVGVAAVLLTASRSGFLAAIAALAGSLVLLAHGHTRRIAVALFALPPFLAVLWFLVPGGAVTRLSTIPEQLQGGDFNQRVNIWNTGWEAFVHAPLGGSGAGTFVAAAHTAPMDSAHNTVLSILVGGGLCALFLASLLVVLAVRAALRTHGPMRLALLTCLLVWAITSLIATVEENRTTWLLFGLAILAARLGEEDPQGMAACFRLAPPQPSRGTQESSTRLVEV
jgi:O-antigen ligase